MQTWFSRLPPAQEFYINGLHPNDARVLRQRWLTRTAPCVDLYEALEKRVGNIGFIQVELQKALRATEWGDMEALKASKNVIFDSLKRHARQAINSEETL